MADNPRKPDKGDAFGWGRQPLHRTDETTGDEGIEPPVGQGHDEAAFGRPGRHEDRKVQEQVPGYPTGPRGPDAQE